VVLSLINQGDALTDTQLLEGAAAGDIAVVFAYRNNSNTPPTPAAGWTTIASSGADTNSSVLGYRVLLAGDFTAGNATTGQWVNATGIAAIILRGQHTSPIGGNAAGGATSSNQVSYPSVTFIPSAPQGLSWVLGFAGHKTATDLYSKAVAGMTNLGGDIEPEWMGKHSAENVASFSASNYTTVVNATAAWRSYAVEIRAAPAQGGTTTGLARISLAPASTPTTRTAHSVTIRARKTNVAHTATIGVHLFEGASQRTSAELTQALTTSFADYTLAILDADAATITSYADLELRIRGYSTPGDLATFEVARVALNLPVGGSFTAPTAPQSLQTPGVEDSQVTLNWSAPASNGGSAVLSYNIYRGLSVGSETLLASPAGTGTSYVDSTVVDGTTYFYKVSAVNAIGESALSNEVSSTPSVSVVVSAVRILKRLYGPAQLDSTAATLYTVPASTQTVIRHIHAFNSSGAPVNFTLSIGASAVGTKLWDATPIAALDPLDHYQDHVLSAGEIIQSFAGSAATLNLVIDGYEVAAGGSAVSPSTAIYPSDTLFPSDTDPTSTYGAETYGEDSYGQ
jgi:hypothetical protein